MHKRTRRSLGVTLTDVVAAAAALTLVAAVAPPSLQRIRQRMAPVACANNLRVCNQAWNVYGGQFSGFWMAPWDRNYPCPGWSDPSLQWPFTMLFYVTGHPITDGQPVKTSEGWWSTQGRTTDMGYMYASEFSRSPEEGSQLQCPEMASRGSVENPIWYHLTSYSYPLMNRRDMNGNWQYDVSNYPVPDFMTHASSTINLHDLSGMPGEGQRNAWSVYGGPSSDPHGGKSNYVFCDGHVEMLSPDQTNERMWQDRWIPETDAAAGE